MGPLAALIRKEFIQFFRSTPLVVLVVWTIALEIAVCAYAITYDVTNVRLAVRDMDGSSASRELAARFARTESFDVRYAPRSAAELDDLLESGRATVGLVVPPDFSRKLQRGERPAGMAVSQSRSSDTMRSMIAPS